MKKLLSFVLVLTLIMSSVIYASAATSTDYTYIPCDPHCPGSETYVFTNPDNWDEVYVYGYGGRSEYEGSDTYPGVKLEPDNSGNYTYSFAVGWYGGLIFNDGTCEVEFAEESTDYFYIPAEDDAVGSITVGFKNPDNWDEVYVYGYGGYYNGVQSIYPGVKLEPQYVEGYGEIYTYSYAVGWYGELIFNNGKKPNLYEYKFVPYLKPYIENWDFVEDWQWYTYEELFYGFGNKGTTRPSEATPDYVLVEASVNAVSPSFSFGIIGDYLLSSLCCGNPDCLRYFIYTPEDDRIYTLKEAYDAGVEGIEGVFEYYRLGQLMGDADGDRELNIRDCTYLQYYLVNEEGYTLPEGVTGHNVYEDASDDYYACVADFNNDNKINIKDVTAIQKRLAHII